MEQTHTLAVVSRAKAIARDAGQAPKDEVLAYLCACADVSGVWQALLQGDDVDAAAQPGSEPAGGLLCCGTRCKMHFLWRFGQSQQVSGHKVVAKVSLTLPMAVPCRKIGFRPM